VCGGRPTSLGTPGEPWCAAPQMYRWNEPHLEEKPSMSGWIFSCQRAWERESLARSEYLLPL